MNIFLCGLIVSLAVYESVYTKKNDFKWRNEGLIAFLVIALSMILFEYKAGILGCGYHFVDDHEVFKFKVNFTEQGIVKAFIDSIISDFDIRFRPTYRLVRTFEALVCGTNFVAWHIFQLLLTITTFFLTYVFARKMSCSMCFSLVFVIVIFIGEQSAALWQLGPQEMMGMLLLMLNLLWLHKSASHNAMKDTIISIALAALLGGAKESFLLLLPVLPVFQIFFDIGGNTARGGHGWLRLETLFKEVKQRKIYIIAILAIFLIDISVILLWVGTVPIGYAGIDASMGIKGYVMSMFHICSRILKWHCTMAGLTVVLLLIPLSVYIFVKKRSELQEYLLMLFFYLVIFGYCFGTQLILYAKSGMYERYLLPSTFAFAFFLIIGLNQMIHSTQINPLCYHVVAIMLTAAIIHGTNIEKNAGEYVQDGMNTTAMLNMIGEIAEPDAQVIVSLMYELDYSASAYLQEEFDIRHVYNINYSDNELGMVSDGYIRNENEMKAATIKCEDADIYIGYLDEIEMLMMDVGLDINDFEQHVYGEYLVYVIK